MNKIICTDVIKDGDAPMYTVKVYDLDTPVNFHSYDCLFFKQGRNLDELLEEAEQCDE